MRMILAALLFAGCTVSAHPAPVVVVDCDNYYDYSPYCEGRGYRWVEYRPGTRVYVNGRWVVKRGRYIRGPIVRDHR